MPKIKNKEYLNFLERGEIDTIDNEQFSDMLNSVSHRHLKAARAFCIFLFTTGRRPSEILALRAKDFKKVRKTLHIQIPTKKGGISSKILLPWNEFTQEFWEFVNKPMFPESFVFYNLLTYPPRKNRVSWIGKDGELKSKIYERKEGKLYYYLNKWFGVPPYFFRHNRFTLAAEKGATGFQIMLMKGARTMDSVAPYLHKSVKEAEKIKKFYK